MKTLICSVGGSPQPIVTSIKESNPDFVLFVCSEDDPVSGKEGTYTLITNEKIKNPQDEKILLPNIPSQAGLKKDQYDLIKVDPDNLESVYLKTLNALKSLREKNGEEQVFMVDYTGGTKSMSTALVLLALDENLQLNLVTGVRTNHVRIERGEKVEEPDISLIRFYRQFQHALIPWQHHAYEEAFDRLKNLHTPRDKEAKTRYFLALHISEAMHAWDRFDHAKALEILKDYRARLGREWGKTYFSLLDKLAEKEFKEKDSKKTEINPIKREPYRILDLWRNAERRAKQGRYDDAVARLYRLLEWTAQWLLKDAADIETGNIPRENIPEHIEIQPNDKGQYRASLIKAWELAAHYLPDTVGSFWKTHRGEMINLLEIRNSSILAHGFKPIREQEWHKMSKWVETHILPLILEYGKKHPYKLAGLPEQLPTEMPEVKF